MVYWKSQKQTDNRNACDKFSSKELQTIGEGTAFPEAVRERQ